MIVCNLSREPWWQGPMFMHTQSLWQSMTSLTTLRTCWKIQSAPVTNFSRTPCQVQFGSWLSFTINSSRHSISNLNSWTIFERFGYRYLIVTKSWLNLFVSIKSKSDAKWLHGIIHFVHLSSPISKLGLSNSKMTLNDHISLRRQPWSPPYMICEASSHLIWFTSLTP